MSALEELTNVVSLFVIDVEKYFTVDNLLYLIFISMIVMGVAGLYVAFKGSQYEPYDERAEYD